MSCASYADWKREGGGRRRFWRPLEVVAIVGGFILFWPVGVALLIWKCMGYPSWSEARGHVEERFGFDMGAAKDEFRRFKRDMKRGGPGRHYRGTGNLAFEEYRERELARLDEERRRIEEEGRAFAEFVEELKRAKDREEFDAFMARRREQQQPGTA